MQIIINGKTNEYPENLTIRELLERLNLAKSFVAVEKNGTIVPYQTFEAEILQNGDVLEMVTLVGGG